MSSSNNDYGKYIGKERWLSLIFGIIVGFLVVWIGYNIFVSATTNWTYFCNEKYGVNHWKTIEITGTKEAQELYPLYIGQVWKCIPK